ncbi:nucleolar RNA helicase 2-B-like, partial [Artemia franciscana]|uniref:nucleolar RNA helicase 2-B-like n=1 Tax=Artemia franciscana TaxID=6661 RepID=UPI0032DB07CD
MDNNLRNHRAAEDGSVLRENLEGRDKSKTFNDDFSSTSQTTSENIFPLHLREDSHDIWLHPSTKTLPNPIKTTGVSLVGVLNPSVDNHSSTESSKADDLVCHGRTKLIERSLVSQRPSSGCSSKSFEVLKWVATQENSPNKFHLEQCHSIHTEIDDHSSGTFLNEDQLRPSFGSQMPFPNYHLNSDKEDVISTFVEEVRHLRQEISSQTSKQEALETLMQKALVELEEANANIMKLRSEIARSTSDDKMTITSIQSSLNILKNEIAQDSFKRTEEISKLETKFSDSQQALEQIEVILIKNEVTSGQRVEVENSLKADLQEVQNKLSALLRDKDAILPNWASFSHAVGTPAQLVPIMQQPVPSEIARKALSIIDPTTDKETSKTELACQSRTESTSEEPRQPDNSEQIKVGLENMVIATFEEPAVADVPSTEESSNKDQIFDSFNKMDLKTELLHGIYSYGLVRPTTLQQKAIVPCLEGNDVVVQAQPGTGKTTMLSISILQKIDTSIKQCQAIVLVPNGEHAQQTQQLLLSFGEQMGTQCHAFVNGTSACEDLKILSSSGVHIVIGPPGRVFDMISRRALNTKYIKLVVLDEADKMLSRGFKDQIYEIFKHFSKNIQVILLSTIMPNDVGEDELFGKYNENDLDVDDEDDVDDDFDVDDVVEVTKLIMRDPIRILIKQEELTLEDIQHFYVTVSTWERANGKAIIAFARTWYNTVSERERYDTLHVTQAIIFCSSADVVHEIMNQLVLCLPIEPTNFLSMHDQMDQKERERILRKFCSGSSRFLITTDLLPVRPIYWQQVSLVINYDIPLTVETYINSFKRTEEISKLEKKFIDSQQALEQIEAILIKNKVTSGQRVEVEHFLKSDLQEVQNKLSAPLRDKDAILPNCAPFSHAVGTPAQLVSITQQPVPSEIARKAFSIIDPTTDKETSKTELASQSRTESTS